MTMSHDNHAAIGHVEPVTKASNDSSIAVLNGLIATTLDSAHGYAEASGAARNQAFKSLFGDRGRERRQLAGDLQAEVRRLGGKPEDDGTMMAAAHRLFLNLKNTVTGSDQSVVAEVEAGEDHIKAELEKALAGEQLPSAARGMVSRIHASIAADHDKMRDLKLELQAQPTR